jgi:hypothetical protein
MWSSIVLSETILDRRIAQAEEAILLADGPEVRHPPSIAKNGDLTLLQLERCVCLQSLRRRTEATKGQHDHAEKGDARAAVLELPQIWAAKGRHRFFFRGPRHRKFAASAGGKLRSR